MITYDDKVALYENADIANINKVTAGDMNEIKKSVNGIVENNISYRDINRWLHNIDLLRNSEFNPLVPSNTLKPSNTLIPSNKLI